MMSWFTSIVKRFWSWVSRHSKKITIPVTVFILIVLSFGGYKFIQFYNYSQDDPDFCYSCHIMETSWDRWATSAHKDIGCHSCHHQSLLAGAQQVVKFVFGNYERVESHAVVTDESCEQCHESGNPKWLQVAATAGHKKHAEEQNIACVKCHSITLHRFYAPGTICNVCHEEKHTEISGMQLMHCTACHDYLVSDEPLLPDRKDCLDCHQALTESGVTWPADAPMQYPCGDCHQPHQQSEPVVDCLSCHTVEGLHLAEAHDASLCQTCHQPHEWQVTRRDTCLTCHPGKDEHNAGALCNSCHNYLVSDEQLLLDRKDCLDCHQAPTDSGVTWPADAPMQYPCGDCHQPHQQTEQVIDCLSCHAVEGLHLAEAHSTSSCVTCHKPHHWPVTQREICLTCHPGKVDHYAGILCGNCHFFPGQ